MKFFQERKRKKELSELKARRHAEDDLLSPACRIQFDEIIEKLEKAPSGDINNALAEAKRDYSSLPITHRGWLYSFLDLVLVVGAVAFGLRGLFFQPFRIPTGSMQPTLYGVHYQQCEGNGNLLFGKLPGVLHNIVFGSVSAKAVNGSEGGIVSELRFVPGSIFDHTEFFIGSRRYLLPGTPHQVADYTKMYEKYSFQPGEKICDGYVSLGDHLFVERVSMYICPPRRGDVIVFNTEGLSVDNVNLADAGGYYYIKRLAALPGDTVKMVGDQFYVRPSGGAEFSRIQDLAPAFKKVYSMRGGYHGHVDDRGTEPFVSGIEYTIPSDHYLMLGDNSRFSMDSRYFGVVPRKNLIGRAWIVFYPFSRRTGFADSREPLDVPTGIPGESSFPVMYRQ